MIVLASDHGGFELKEEIKKFFDKTNTEYKDVGAFEYDQADDYPDFAQKAVPIVLENTDNAGIFICGSGIGMNMVANRYKGIRAVVANDLESAFFARKDEDANVLCMGARFISKKMALKIVKMFFKTEFEGGRHSRRISKY